MSPTEHCEPGVHFLQHRHVRRHDHDSKGTAHEQGQATIEFALLLPLAVGCLALVIQTLVLVLGHISLHHEARIAVRAAAVAADPEAAARAAVQSNDPQSTSLIEIEITAQLVTVRVHRQIPVVVPVLGQLWPDFDISARLTMALEPPIEAMALH